MEGSVSPRVPSPRYLWTLPRPRVWVEVFVGVVEPERYVTPEHLAAWAEPDRQLELGSRVLDGRHLPPSVPPPPHPPPRLTTPGPSTSRAHFSRHPLS